MPENLFNNLRLSFMQEALPVGMAILERAKKGGPNKVVEAFVTDSDDPIDQLRQEGEPAARSIRDKLDNIKPGLGNPVMNVDVSVDAYSSASPGAIEKDLLLKNLNDIELRLDLLRKYIDKDFDFPQT
tara:strand:- start:251 stop:634 length:384 start_codon:yes stop_codon:yes gene_type:complete